MPHFIGTIATQLEPAPLSVDGLGLTFRGRPLSTGERITIIEGQQRLAMLSIFTISVVQKIKELAERRSRRYQTGSTHRRLIERIEFKDEQRLLYPLLFSQRH